MDRWYGKVALVTGASAGIGAAICRALVHHGLKVVGAARRVDKIQTIADELSKEKGSLIAVKCDVTKDKDVYDLFKKIEDVYGGVDICINNAGSADYIPLLDGSPEIWRNLMDLNVVALCLCSKLTVSSLRQRGIDQGHIVNISSILGHRVYPISQSHFYGATKHAVRAISEGLRQELREAKSHIRVSMISPGYVETELLDSGLRKGGKPDFYKECKVMQPNDIAQSVIHVISAPSHVEINDMIILATEQKS